MCSCGSATNIQDHTHGVLSANARWARRMNQTFSQYFPDPKDGQAPKALWVGCSDSRVLDSDATVSLPGDMFVHRNIANQFLLTDDNALSVFAYAVKTLGVQHIVVVGHEHCGGALSALRAARKSSTTRKDQPEYQIAIVDSLSDVEPTEKLNEVHEKSSRDPNDAITRWLTPLINRVKEILPTLPSDEEAAVKIVIEENVKLQIENLGRLGGWVHKHAKKKPVWVHGWVCDFSTGTIRDLQLTRKLAPGVA